MKFMTKHNISDETVESILEDGWILHSINILPYSNIFDNKCTPNSIEREFYFIKDTTAEEEHDNILNNALKELIQIAEYKNSLQ